MLTIRGVVYAYFALVLVLLLAMFVLAMVVEQAMPRAWTEDAIKSLLEMLKVSVGAAVGSLTTVGGAIVQSHQEKKKSE